MHSVKGNKRIEYTDIYDVIKFTTTSTVKLLLSSTKNKSSKIVISPTHSGWLFNKVIENGSNHLKLDAAKIHSKQISTLLL